MTCFNFHGFLLVSIWIVLLSSGLSHEINSNIECLRSIKESLEDPFNYLNSTWNFNNNTEGFICKFIGVDCWHPDENKVLNIRLADMGLKGQFPVGLKDCTSLSGLDLSSNELSGPIPDDINLLVGFLTSLDLSSNAFSGSIPANLSKCSYLNVLNLDHNKLTGSIPGELTNLNRIKAFNVANNRLVGPVPRFWNAIPAKNYANNQGLCGGPNLEHCGGDSVSGWHRFKNDRASFVAAHVAGGSVVAVGLWVVVLLYFLRKREATNGSLCYVIDYIVIT